MVKNEKIISLFILCSVALHTHSQEILDQATKDINDGMFLITKLDELNDVNERIDANVKLGKSTKNSRVLDSIICSTRPLMEKKLLIINELIDSEILLDANLRDARDEKIEDRVKVKAFLEMTKSRCL